MQEREPASYGHFDSMIKCVLALAWILAGIGVLLLIVSWVKAFEDSDPKLPTGGFLAFLFCVLGAIGIYASVIVLIIFLDMARNVRFIGLELADVRRQIAEQNPHEQARAEAEKERLEAAARKQDEAARLKAEREEAERMLKKRLAEERAKEQAEREEQERLRREHIKATKERAHATLNKIARKAERAYTKYRDDSRRLDELVDAVQAEVDQLLEETQKHDEAHQTKLTREVQHAFNGMAVFRELDLELQPG